MGKRFSAALCAVIFCFALVLHGCASSDNNDENTAAVTHFTADFKAEFNDMEIKGRVISAAAGTTGISVTYPEALSGLSLEYKNAQLSISREGVMCTADEAYLPLDSFPSVLKGALNELAYNRLELSRGDGGIDGEFKTLGKTGSAQFDKDGKIKSISLEALSFYVEFSNVCAI